MKKLYLLLKSLKNVVLIAFAAFMPVYNFSCFWESNANSTDYLCFYLLSFLFILLVIPVFAIISLALPKNPVFDRKDAMFMLSVSFILWVLFMFFEPLKEDTSLDIQNETVAILEQGKKQFGRYPDAMDLPEGETYYQKDRANFVLTKRVKQGANDIIYRYCSNPCDEECKERKYPDVDYSYIGKWQKMEFTD